MTSRHVLRWLLFACAAVCSGGCGRNESVIESGPDSSFFKVGDKSGMTTLTYKNCTLVFEDVPSKTVSVGSQGAFNSPGPPGSSGGSDSSFGDLKIKQKFDSQANDVSVNGHDFKITNAGKKLVFPDATYDLDGTPMTIVVGADGKTHKE